MQESTAIAGLRWKPGEVERVAREMAQSGLRQYYETKKQEFLSFHGDMLEALLSQGRVLAEMRKESPRLLHWLHLEIGLDRDYLDNIADFWEIFQEELPRRDISPQYYLQTAQAIKVIEDSWEGNEEVVGQVKETAVELLGKFKPENQGPRSLAASLAQLFGIINLGAKPFSGLPIRPGLPPKELKRMAQEFHPLVRPLFLEHARRIQIKGAEVEEGVQPLSIEPTAVMLTLTFRIQNPSEDLERITGKIADSLRRSGIPAKLVKSHFYTPLRERLRLLSSREEE